MTPYLRCHPAAAPATGHKWELDARSGVERCGETWWSGPMRDCTKAEKAEVKR